MEGRRYGPHPDGPEAADRSWETDVSEDEQTRRRLVAVLTSPRLRFGLLAILVIGLFATFLVVGAPSRDRIAAFVGSAGPAAPVMFVLLYVAASVLVVPGAVLTVAAGVLFGTAFGTVLAVVGASLGAAAAFEIGRWLGREQVERVAGERISRFDDWLERRGFTAVLYVRLIPVIPFNVLNYAAGVTGLRRRDYLLGTVVGIVPGTLAYAALGGNFDDPTSPAFIAAVVLIVALALGGPVVNRVLRRRGRGAPPSTADDDTEPDPSSDPSEVPS